MVWLTSLFLFGVVWSSPAVASCIEALPPSPTPLGENAIFRCCFKDAIIISWNVNETDLSDETYANASISSLVYWNGSLCQNLTLPTRYEDDRITVECLVRVLDGSESVRCGSENLTIQVPSDPNTTPAATPTSKGPGTGNGDTSSLPTLDPTTTPTEGPSSDSTTIPGILAGVGVIAVIAIGLCVLIVILCRHKIRDALKPRVAGDANQTNQDSTKKPGEGAAENKVYLVSESNSKSELELGTCRTIIYEPDTKSQLEPGRRIRGPPRPSRHADLSRQGDKSGGTEMTEAASSSGALSYCTFVGVVIPSKDMPQDCSPHSPPVLTAKDDCEIPDDEKKYICKQTGAVASSDT